MLFLLLVKYSSKSKVNLMVSVSEGTMWTSLFLSVFCVMTAFSVSKEKTFSSLLFIARLWVFTHRFLYPQSYLSEKLNKKF
jgi:hypothetical protein